MRTAEIEMLTPAEAAVVSAVSLRTIHRMVDEHILPASLIGRAKGRRIAVDACLYITFFENTADQLTREARKRIIQQAVEKSHSWHVTLNEPIPKDGWTLWEDGVGVNFHSFAKHTVERFRLLSAARNAVVSDPEILGGEPVMRGTRVPVHAVAGAVTAGASTAELLEDYPSLNADMIASALVYAKAYPRQGAPKSFGDRHKLTPNSSLRVSRSTESI